MELGEKRMFSAAEERIDEGLGAASVGFGLMVADGREKSIDYTLFEVSHHSIGMISSDTLEVGQRVTIEHRESTNFPLLVYQIVPKRNLPEGFKRYRLICLDPGINFEKMLPESNHRKTALSTRQHYHIRFARFPTDIPLAVDARTFGAAQSYLMKTINISKSGFLLATPQGFGVPFHETTLLELKLALEEGQKVQCLGKVIRYEVDFEKKIKRYGVNVCEITPEDWERYTSFVEDIEHRKNRQIFRQLRIPMPF
ncbi:MAG: PilZ domain-containing protein [Oligoflexus sp.]|jgi:hypothetical protein